MIPPRSPWGLIQEDLWPDAWRILVACMCLNCTTRKQVEKVLPELFKRWPDAASMSTASTADVADVISPLGFRNRRSAALIKMSTAYQTTDWVHAKELPGIGAYAAAAWEIFCRGSLPQQEPQDHALTHYYRWRKNVQ